MGAVVVKEQLCVCLAGDAAKQLYLTIRLKFTH